MKGNLSSVVTLLLLAGAIYVFSPQSPVLKSSTSSSSISDNVLRLSIKNRSLADPTEGDLRAKVGMVTILEITTDEDGRVSLRGGEREDVFNPVFSGAINTITIPTDRVGSYVISFYPTANPNNPTSPQDATTIGSIVVEN